MLNYLSGTVKAGTVMIHGHRGARGLYPENTMPAFIEATRLGVDAVELDVVISKDREVVVSHEAWMNHLFCTQPDGQPVEDDPGRYNLYRMTYSEIKAYDCGQRGHPEFAGQKARPEHKPLLREVIAGVEAYTNRHHLPPILYNIEIKTELPDNLFNPEPGIFVDLVDQELKKQKVMDRVHLQSFDVRILQEIKKKQMPVSLGLLVEEQGSLQMHLDRLGFLPEVYSPDFALVDEKLANEVQQAGMRLIPWTVNGQADVQRLVMLGVDGIITDYPDKVMEWLKQKK